MTETLEKNVRRWVNMKDGTNLIFHVVPNFAEGAAIKRYDLYIAYKDNKETSAGEDPADYRGRILVDGAGCWIYDGDDLEIVEQEQIGNYIVNYGHQIR